MEQNDSTFHSVESFVLGSMEKLLQVIRQASGEFVLVSSEVGLSLVPPEPLGRRFQDLLGTVNQRAAAAADRVYLVVVGIPTQIKGLS
jgi:adenosyl cobinamide kinase/adenosyl cobinamide phosphate guanylyltransferase